MPHLDSTDYFQNDYQAVRYYRTYGCDEAEVKRKIRDGEITIGEPPEKMGAIRRAPGGHFHYEYPDVPAPDKTEAQLRALNRPKPRFPLETDEWGDDTDPKLLAKSKMKAADTPMLAFLRSCTLEGLVLHVPSERIDAKVYAEAKKALLIFGGKWNTGKQCFSFTKDPSSHIATLLGTGVVVNEKKNRQAYYTPAEVAEVVVDAACLEDHHVVLEPSIGGGSLALACLEAGAARVVGYEIDPDEAALVHDPRISVTLADFLTVVPPTRNSELFDRIVMNPPFTKGQDVKHVLHAFRFLAKSGRLLAIVPDKDHPKLAHLNPETIERFPAGSFKESGTSVATRVIQILS